MSSKTTCHIIFERWLGCSSKVCHVWRWIPNRIILSYFLQYPPDCIWNPLNFKLFLSENDVSPSTNRTEGQPSLKWQFAIHNPETVSISHFLIVNDFCCENENDSVGQSIAGGCADKHLVLHYSLNWIHAKKISFNYFISYSFIVWSCWYKYL